MLSATAIQTDCDYTTYFEPPTEERRNSLFTSMFRDKARRAVQPHDVLNGLEYGVTGNSFPEKKSGPDTLAALMEQWRLLEIETLMQKIRSSRSVPVGECVSNRLRGLRQCFKEEEGMDISLDSLRAVFSFLDRSIIALKPDVSLTPDGDVYLRWKRDAGHLFALHFRDDRRVRFALFIPNPRHLRKVSRYSGYETLDTVLDSADKLGSVRTWICQ